MAAANDLRKGMAIKYNGNPAIVLEVHHRTPGNLRAFVQAIIRYINTGKSADVRFGSTDKVELVDIERKQLEFSYKDRNGYYFMDPETYDTITLAKATAGKCACPTIHPRDPVVRGSVLLSSAQICVICGNFGCNEAQIEKESRYAQFEARPESCPQLCARATEKLHGGIRAAHSAHKVGEICYCGFSAADLRRSYPDIFHGVRARDCAATVVGGRRVLVLLVRRGAVADSFFRSAAPNLDLRVRARAYACALGLVDGWSGEPVPRGPRRRTRGYDQGELLDRAGTVFLPDLQHPDDRHLRRTQPFSKHATVWAAALRRDWRHLGVPFHVHLLDDSQEPDGPYRSGHIFFSRSHLPDEFAVAQRDADSGVPTNHV